MKIFSPKTDAEIAACFRLLKQIRINIQEDTFVADIHRMQGEGFKLLCLVDEGAVKAVAGYRIMEMLATGRNLYIDDLVTDATVRSKGYGKALMDWLFAEAKRTNCKYLELDSGTERIDAHRFYRKQGLEEIALHFSAPIGDSKRWASELSK